MEWLVKEIQIDILNNKSITDILRKTLILYKKLNLDDIEFIEKELNGYNDDDKIPNYRIISWYRILGWNPYNWWILASINDDKLFKKLVVKKILYPISEIIKFEKWASMSLSNDIMWKIMDYQTEYKLEIAGGEFSKIIELVKNLLLNRCIELENNGILWEWISFSKEEIEKAKSINNTTNIFNWPINDSNLQVSTTNSKQKNINNDFDSKKLNELISQITKLWNEIKKLPKWDIIIKSFEEIKIELDNNKPDKSIIKDKIISIKDTLNWINWSLIASWILKLIWEVF